MKTPTHSDWSSLREQLLDYPKLPCSESQMDAHLTKVIKAWRKETILSEQDARKPDIFLHYGQIAQSYRGNEWGGWTSINKFIRRTVQFYQENCNDWRADAIADLTNLVNAANKQIAKLVSNEPESITR